MPQGLTHDFSREGNSILHGRHLLGNFDRRISQSRRIGRKPDGAVVHFVLLKIKTDLFRDPSWEMILCCGIIYQAFQSDTGDPLFWDCS